MKRSSIANKLIAGSIVLLLALHSLVPCLVPGRSDCAAFETAIQIQTNLLYYYSFSIVPLEIISNLLLDAAAKTGAARRLPEKEKEKPSNTSAGFSFIAYGKTPLKSPWRGFPVEDHPVTAADGRYAPGNAAVQGSIGGSATAQIMLLALMCILVLPRASISDASVLMALRDPIRKIS